MNHEQLATQYFLDGYNCAQAVFLAFAPEIGLEPDLALRLSSSFGGGMGKLREVCGAVSGMLMAAGALYGYTTPADDVVEGQHYTLVQELAGRFREVHGALTCRELLNRPGPESPIPDAFNAAVYASRPCARFVGTAARILEEYMAEHPPKVR